MSLTAIRVIATTVAILIANCAQAADAYVVLSKAVVLAVVSPDLLGDTKINPRPFAKCFRAQGLTKKDLKVAVHTGSADRALFGEADWVFKSSRRLG
jgi:hypothetical protein